MFLLTCNESIAHSFRAIGIDPTATTADGGLWSILSVFVPPKNAHSR